MRLTLLVDEAWTIYDADDALSTFLEDLEAQYSGMAAQVFPLLERMAEGPQGPKCLNKKVCHRIDDAEDIWQIRKGKVRVLWFYDEGRIIVCAHAFLKKSQKTPSKERNKARRIKADYFEAKAANQIIVSDDTDN